MKHLAATTLLDTPLARAWRVTCRAPRAAAGEEEHNATPQIVLATRGVFAIHRGNDATLADPTGAVVFGPGEDYRASHPLDGGDECLTLEFRADVHEEALGDVAGRDGRIAPRTHLAARTLTAAAGERCESSAEPAGGSGAVSTEGALLLLDAVAADLRASPPPPVSNPRADEVRILLASDPGRRWRLDDVARAVHCSPFHLARQFRRTTGETIGRHLLRLRLAVALDRIERGEDDLARLAADLGFAHHSHLTARFRTAFGETPSAVRRIVTARRAADA